MRRLALVGLALVAAAVIVTAVVGGSTSDLDRARSVVTDDDGFETGEAAGESLADAAELLLRAARDCTDANERCDAIASAAGYVQIVAAHVVRCTAPGRAEVREAAIGVIDAAREGELVESPALPDCG